MLEKTVDRVNRTFFVVAVDCASIEAADLMLRNRHAPPSTCLSCPFLPATLLRPLAPPPFAERLTHECARHQTVAFASACIAPSLVTSPVDSWNYYDVVAIVENQIDIALRARLAGPKVAAWCALVFRGRGHARRLVGRSAAVVTQASPSLAGGCNSGRYTRGQAWPVQVGGDDARQTAAVC